jgi:adenosylcobinamide-phosphate synthase
MTPIEITGACLADLLLGDPHGYPHPVKLVGKAIQLLEGRLLGEGDSPFRQYLLGGLLAVTVVLAAGFSTWALLRVAASIHPGLSLALTVFFAYTTLAARNLYDEAKRVIEALDRGDLARARKAIGFLVSRDTDGLDESEVGRALIETVSENTSDGIIAPLFYLIIGGPPLAMAYKALNTLDSMVGYKTDRYRYFGWASARADDLANFVPARLTAILFVLASFVLGKNWKGAWKVAWRDGRKNASPNSGYPEAAAAGALGVQLGGMNCYFGRWEKKPFIGDPEKPITLQETRESLRLMIAASLIAMTVASLSALLMI